MKTWLLDKILSYLSHHEGCLVDDEVDTSPSSARTIIQDAFGYRYEIQVKVLGRIHGDYQGGGEQLKTGSYLSIQGEFDV